MAVLSRKDHVHCLKCGAVIDWIEYGERGFRPAGPADHECPSDAPLCGHRFDDGYVSPYPCTLPAGHGPHHRHPAVHWFTGDHGDMLPEVQTKARNGR